MSEEMTKEQARNTLRNAAWLGTNEDRERIEKAVELLCGEPCEELPSAQPEPSEITDEQAIRHLQSTGWMQNHDREMYESGLREKLADDSGSYDSLIPCKDAISRQAAHEAVYSANGLAGAMKKIDALPSVTPMQRTGHWIETADEYYKAVNEYGGGVNEDTPYFVDDIACSVCLAKYSVIDNETERFDCCPSCGAKMFEPQENCDTCKHKDNGWDSEQCDGCCGANSKWSGESYPGEFEAMEHNGRMDALESEEQA